MMGDWWISPWFSARFVIFFWVPYINPRTHRPTNPPLMSYRWLRAVRPPFITLSQRRRDVAVTAHDRGEWTVKRISNPAYKGVLANYNNYSGLGGPMAQSPS